MSQVVYHSDDIYSEFAENLNELGAKRVFIFTGKNSYSNATYREKFESVFSSCEKVEFYNDLIPNPTLESVQRGIEVYKSEQWDLVVAIGGGSVIDSAKIITFFAGQKFSISEYFKNKPSDFEKIPEIWAIPTTSGTGSESTQFATFYINKVKHSLDLPVVLPKNVFLHADFTMDLPPYITACTAADALCQAIESYWNVNSTDHSRDLAEGAISTIIPIFERCVLDPTAETRTAMAIGSNLAGQAIQITRTTAAHAVSYPMTSFFDIPHGQAVCVTLPSFIQFNAAVSEAELSDQRGVQFVKETIQNLVKLLGCTTAKEAKTKLETIFKNCGLKGSLGELGIKSNEDIETIIKNGFNPARVKNNPRVVTEENLRELLIALI